MKVENFKPTGNNVLVKSEMIKKSGIVLLEETKESKELVRFRVVRCGPKVEDPKIQHDSIVWLRPHSAISSYHEDKEKNYHMLPETDIQGVLNE